MEMKLMEKTFNIPKLELENFSTYSTKELMAITEVNKIEDMEIDINVIEGLKYMKVHNIMKRPLDLSDFMRNFPAENKEKSSMEELSFSGSKSPGLQQPIERAFMTFLGYQLWHLCKQMRFLKYREKDISWKYYSNFYYKGMRSFNKNFLPHVDPFSYAANIFLTESEQHGTSFFKYTDERTGKDFYSMADVMSAGHEIRTAYTDGLKENYQYQISDPDLDDRDVGRMTPKNGDDEWTLFEGDHFYKRYHFLPSTFNSMSMYRGNRWHSATFDAKNTKCGRYSLVACIL